nr:glycosyltransferase [Paraflavitalea speifideiaquila]
MITIITPTWNREVLVQTTIQSIQQQTYQDWELIIVDDGSTDNTQQVLQPYLADKRIRYIKNTIPDRLIASIPVPCKPGAISSPSSIAMTKPTPTGCKPYMNISKRIQAFFA